jgi:hypothetical protein
MTVRMTVRMTAPEVKIIAVLYMQSGGASFLMRLRITGSILVLGPKEVQESGISLHVAHLQ